MVGQLIRVYDKNNTDFYLRDICVDDLEYLRLWKNKNRKSFFYQETISPEQQKGWFEAFCKRVDDRIFMLEEVISDGSSHTIGCMGYRLQNSRVIDLYNIIRGQESIKHVQMKDAMCLMLNFIIKEYQDCQIKCDVLINNPAVLWYQKCGFEIIERKEYYVMKINVKRIERLKIDIKQEEIL